MTATVHYGPYDVTDYEDWQAALDAGVGTASSLTPVIMGSKLLFVEVRVTEL